MVAARIRLLAGHDFELLDELGGPVSIRPTSARLLAALLADLGDEVSTGVLVRRTWGESPPSDPNASLHTAVARLRSVMPAGSVVRGEHGYCLRLDPEMVVTEDQTATISTAQLIAPTFTPSTPLVGRDALLTRAMALVERGRGVILHGDAGTGRSRLVEEIVLRAFRDGRPATLLRCRSVGDDVPLGTYSPLLQGTLPAAGLPLVIAARTSIAQRLDGQVMVLGIDDLHQIDPLSAVLTMQLVHGGHAVLVGTHRNIRVVPVPVADLWHSGYCEHVHVGHLDRAGLGLFAHVHGGAALDDVALERLWTLTNGNPLFAATVLQHPDLRLLGHDPTLEAVIVGQLAGLSTELRDALAVVAIGEPLSVALLEQIVDIDALIALERASLITIDRHGGRTDVRVRHPLYGEHVRAGTSRLLARGIRGQLADALAAHGAHRRDDLMRLAAWSLDGGRALDPTLGIAAAREALRHDDIELARRTARAVWESNRAVDAAIVLAEAALIDQPGASVIAVVDEALPTADQRQRRRLLTIGARAAVLKMGDTAEAERLLAGERDDPVLTAIHAQLLAYQGRGADALAVLERGATSKETDVYRAVAHATALTQLGRADEALELIDTALAALAPLGDAGRSMAHQITAARARPLMLLGRLDEAEQALRDGLHGGREANDPQAEALNALALGGLLPFLGRPNEAHLLAQRALDLLQASGHRTLMRWAWMSAGFAAMIAGDTPAAEAALEALEGIDIPTMTDGVEPIIAGGAARLRFERERAATVLSEGAAMCQLRELVFEEACVLHDLARLGHGASERLTELGAQVGGMVQTFAVHAGAIDRSDPNALLEAAERFEAHGAFGLAAEAVARAAEAANASGHLANARRLVERFHHLAKRCDVGLVAPPIVVAEPLTPREREIGEMAARGWTNAAIAEHLDLSVRTVDNHLSRTFEKLGVEGRAELAPTFGLIRD